MITKQSIWLYTFPQGARLDGGKPEPSEIAERKAAREDEEIIRFIDSWIAEPPCDSESA